MSILSKRLVGLVELKKIDQPSNKKRSKYKNEY